MLLGSQERQLKGFANDVATKYYARVKLRLLMHHSVVLLHCCWNRDIIGLSLRFFIQTLDQLKFGLSWRLRKNSIRWVYLQPVNQLTRYLLSDLSLQVRLGVQRWYLEWLVCDLAARN